MKRMLWGRHCLPKQHSWQFLKISMPFARSLNKVSSTEQQKGKKGFFRLLFFTAAGITEHRKICHTVMIKIFTA